MHMQPNLHDDPVFDCDSRSQSNILLERLKPQSWPISIKDLPDNTALVGGSVRDGILNRLKEFPDLDLVVPDNALHTAEKLAKKIKGTCFVLDAERDIARLVIKDWTIDIAAQNGKTLNEDLSKRDFTVNAIAIILKPPCRVFDPIGGCKDLKRKRLVAIHEENLLEDPLRLLRGMRIMAELELKLDTKTKLWILKHHKSLLKVSPERIQAELQKFVRAQAAEFVFPILIKSRLLSPWLNSDSNFSNGLPTIKDSTLLTNTELSVALPLARLTYLLSNEGLKKLRFSKKDQLCCDLLRQWKNRKDDTGFKSLSEIERFQLHQDLEQVLPALIIELDQKLQREWISRWRDQTDPLFHPSPPIDGNSLRKSFNLPSGKLIGLLIKHLSIEHAFGRLNSRKQILHSARSWLTQNQNSLD